jgi:hypothetical protein
MIAAVIELLSAGGDGSLDYRSRRFSLRNGGLIELSHLPSRSSQINGCEIDVCAVRRGVSRLPDRYGDLPGGRSDA